MNENFINTWVANSELGRIQSLREPIAKRREREGKTFDATHLLAEAIIKGWKTGSKKGSPVDCFVISSDFKLMGRQLVNDLDEDRERSGWRYDYEYYLVFLKEALEGKQPGLGNVMLTREHPSQSVLDLFQRSVVDCVNYTVVTIDATAFENGGTLTIDLEVGKGDSDGTFYLVNGETKFPTTEGIPKNDLLAWAWSESGETGQITHRFDRAQRFKLGAIGPSKEEEACINAFHAKISVAENQQVEPSEEKRSESDEDTPEAPLSELRVSLDSAQLSQEILDVFRAPGDGYQDYTVANIDTTAFEEGGTLIIDIHVGSADVSGSFDLFDSDTKLPTEGYPTGALASMWGIRPTESGEIRHHFARGKVFKFGATGDWYGEKGNTNAFRAKISVEPVN